MDVKTAFLNRHIDEDIYMEAAEGDRAESESQVCKLAK